MLTSIDRCLEMLTPSGTLFAMCDMNHSFLSHTSFISAHASFRKVTQVAETHKDIGVKWNQLLTKHLVARQLQGCCQVTP